MPDEIREQFPNLKEDIANINYIQEQMVKEQAPDGSMRFYARQKLTEELKLRHALVAAGFKRADLTLSMQRVREALSANKVIVASHEGQITDERTYIDYKTRLAATDMVFKMIPGVYTPQQIEKNTSEITLEVITLAPDGTKTAVRVHT